VTVRVLCAGDRFITADALAEQAIAQLAGFGPVEVIRHSSGWPDEPWTDRDGVREAAGDPGEMAALATDVDVLVTHLAPVTAQLINGAAGLRMIGSTRGGPVNIDVSAATARGIPVGYLPGRNLSAAAEFAVGMMIAVTRNIGAGTKALASGRWDGRYFRRELTGPELGSSTVGLIGFGAIGAHVTRLLLAFGAKVLVCDPYAPADKITGAGAEPVDLEHLLAGSEIVSMHARLTPETTGLADAAFFRRMRTGSYFVNTARGELVESADLTAALQSGKLAGAAIDVWDPEPPAADDPVPRMPRVVATPHLAGSSRRVSEFSASAVIAAVAQFLDDGSLPHCANPETLQG
jgi:D-3-phosphoglycerate dehydrogenase